MYSWKPALLWTLVAFTLTTSLKAEVATAPTARPVDAIIRDFNAANFNNMLSVPKDQRPAMIKDIRARRNALAMEFLRTAPQDPRLADVMRDRWLSMSSLSDPALEPELDHIIATSTNQRLVNQARVSKVNDTSMQLERKQIDLPTAQKVYDAYLANPENDNYAAAVMTQMAYYYPKDKQIEIYQELLRKYPHSDSAPLTERVLHGLQALGKPFPLTFDDAITGKHIDTKDLQGKVVVIDFWATWCHPCVEAIPHLKAMYDREHDRGLEVIGVTLDKSVAEGGLAKLKAFVADNLLTWPQYYEGKFWDNELAKKWGVIGIPQVFVLDRKGNLVSMTSRFTVEKDVERLLNDSVSMSSPSQPVP